MGENEFFFLRLKRTADLANWSTIHQELNKGVQNPTVVKRLVLPEDGIIKVNSLLIPSLVFILSHNLLLTVPASTLPQHRYLVLEYF